PSDRRRPLVHLVVHRGARPRRPVRTGRRPRPAREAAIRSRQGRGGKRRHRARRAGAPASDRECRLLSERSWPRCPGSRGLADHRRRGKPGSVRLVPPGSPGPPPGDSRMRVGLVVHEGREEVTEFARRLVDAAAAAGVEVVASDGAADLVPADPSAGEPEMVVAVGGDGTMLAAVQVAMRHEVPLFGFNLGTIGFLTESEPDELEKVFVALASGDYSTAPRMGLRATLNGTTAQGLNDVVVEKIDTLRLVQLAVEINE